MNFYDIVHEIARKNGMSLEKLSVCIGRSETYLASSKSRGSLPKINNAAKIANACGYTLCMVPSNKVPKDAIVIEE